MTQQPCSFWGCFTTSISFLTADSALLAQAFCNWKGQQDELNPALLPTKRWHPAAIDVRHVHWVVPASSPWGNCQRMERGYWCMSVAPVLVLLLVILSSSIKEGI